MGWGIYKLSTNSTICLTKNLTFDRNACSGTNIVKLYFFLVSFDPSYYLSIYIYSALAGSGSLLLMRGFQKFAKRK